MNEAYSGPPVWIVISLMSGVIDEVRVTNDDALAVQWKEELDRELGIGRDDEGNLVEGNENEVHVVAPDRFEFHI